MKYIAIISLIAFCASETNTTRACCAFGHKGQTVVNADQTVLMIWDPKTKTEHFIRKAAFKAEGNDFAFLVPSPSRPELSESGNEVFPRLEEITTPPRLGRGGSNALPAVSPVPQGKVTVLERKEVAGFDAAVLSASSSSALADWLQKNDYNLSPEVEAWAAPYVHDGWIFTALKVAKDAKSKTDNSVRAGALRITFQTDRPLFPYREPDSREAAKKIGAAERILRIFFISDARYDGGLSGGHAWSGKAVWSKMLPQQEKENILKLAKLPAKTGPENWWLTEFVDHWAYAIAPGDLYFSTAKDQKTL